jgi:ATP-dependent DNA ligase
MCGGNAVCLGFAPTDEDAYECALKPYRIYRARGGEGLMVKERDSMHEVGRTEASGSWWKRKIDLYAVDAVLVYAQRGRRAGLYADFTFAVCVSGAICKDLFSGVPVRFPRMLQTDRRS